MRELLHLGTRNAIAAVAGLVLVAALTGGCDDQPWSDAKIKSEFHGDPYNTGHYLASEDTLTGFTRAHVHALLGRPHRVPAARFEEWTNGCSGTGCYWLDIEYDADGRVKDTTWGDV